MEEVEIVDIAHPRKMATRAGIRSGETKVWMIDHSVQDLRDLAKELSDRGEDNSEIVDLVKKMEELEHELGVHEHPRVATLKDMERLEQRHKEDVLA